MLALGKRGIELGLDIYGSDDEDWRRSFVRSADCIKDGFGMCWTTWMPRPSRMTRPPARDPAEPRLLSFGSMGAMAITTSQLKSRYISVEYFGSGGSPACYSVTGSADSCRRLFVSGCCRPNCVRSGHRGVRQNKVLATPRMSLRTCGNIVAQPVQWRGAVLRGPR
jgi:hypothetical protein